MSETKIITIEVPKSTHDLLVRTLVLAILEKSTEKGPLTGKEAATRFFCFDAVFSAWKDGMMSMDANHWLGLAATWLLHPGYNDDEFEAIRQVRQQLATAIGIDLESPQ